MRGEDHAWCADAALGSAFFEEALLDGMKFFIDGKAFDGRDLGSFGLQDWDETGIDEIAVDQDCTCSAFAFSAAFFGSCEV